MSSVITRSLKSFILVILIYREVLTDWVGLQSGIAYIPAHVYPIQLTSFEELNVSLTWNQTANLDIHIYEQGKDFLNMSAYAQRSVSNSANSQNFTFTSLYNKTYFIKVFGSNIGSNRILSYNLKLVTSLITLQYSGIFVQNYSSYNALLIPNILSSNNLTDIGYKIQINSTITPTVTWISQSSTVRLASQSVLALCDKSKNNSNISNHEDLILILEYTLSSAYNLTPFSYIVSYYEDYPVCKCQKNQQWNNKTKECQKKIFQQIENWKYYLAVIGPLIPAIVCAIAVPIWRCKKDKNLIENSFDEVQFNETHHYISQEDCSICLGSYCNYITKCRHSFHRICILEWIKKNRICPLCRVPI